LRLVIVSIGRRREDGEDGEGRGVQEGRTSVLAVFSVLSVFFVLSLHELPETV
jgi:hypothetical protein